MNPDAAPYQSSRVKRHQLANQPPPAISPVLHHPAGMVHMHPHPHPSVSAQPPTISAPPVGAASLPHAPSPLAPTKLRAVAKPFEPKAPVTPSASSSVSVGGAPAAGTAAPPPPSTAPPPPPQYSAVAARLNVDAVPYTPTKPRSSQNQTPTNSGTPAFPETPLGSTSSQPAPPLPVAAGPVPPAAPPALLNASASLSREGSMTPLSTPCSPSAFVAPKATAPPNPFEKSQLPVPEEVRVAADAMPLNVPWCLWADDHPLTAPSEAKDKFQLPVMMHEVSDLATFWRLFWNTPAPSACEPSWTYCWFRRGITPVWEDPRNKNGGAITIVVYDNDKMSAPKETMDDAWMLFVLAVSGESLPESAAVNGLTLKIRAHRPVQLQIWTNVSDETRLRALADGIRRTANRVLNPKQTERLEFFSHDRIHAHTQQKTAHGKKPKQLEPNFTLM